MKIQGVNYLSEKTKAEAKSTHILPLVPSEPEELRKDQTSSFSLRVDPTDPDSVTYKFSMQVIEGTEEVRTILSWKTNVDKVLVGFNITTGAAQKQMIDNLCKHTAKALFEQTWNAAARLVRERRAVQAREASAAGGGNPAAQQAAYEAIANTALLDADNTTLRVIQTAIDGVIKGCVPDKTLQRVKRNMRREMRKPVDMKVRQHFVHLSRLNNELESLPPFGNDQGLSEDELIDILIHAVPKSWTREMDRQGFDPVVHSLGEVVSFLERVETAEQGHENNNTKSSQKASSKTSSSYKKGSKSSGSGNHYCMVHGKNATHSTENCNQLKKEASRLKSGNNDGKSKNKTWKNKDSYKKKEHNTLEALVSESVQHELQKAAKKRKVIKDDDSSATMSINAIEEALNDIEFDDAKSVKSEGEISV